MSSHAPDPGWSSGATPVRILYLRDTLTVCGPGRTMLNTWKTIDRSKFQLVFAATRPAAGQANRLLDTACQQDAETVEIGIGRGVDLSAVRHLVRLIRERRIDILQTHDAQTRRIGVLAAALTGTIHITSVEGWIFNDVKQHVSTWLDKRLIRAADAVIAVSAHLQAQLVGAGVSGDRITVLRNAIVPESEVSARRDPPATWAVDGSRPVVSIVGRLSAEKGHGVFLDAAQRISRTRPDVTFLVVGEGPLEADLRCQAASRGLSGQVVFAGHCSDVASVYEATDLLVISSFTEGLPYVLLEASAHGKPTVATSVGGIPEVVRDGETGWLVAPGDASAIADRVLRCLSDPAARRRMGEEARADIARRFDGHARTRALERLYDCVATGRSHRRAS